MLLTHHSPSMQYLTLEDLSTNWLETKKVKKCMDAKIDKQIQHDYDNGCKQNGKITKMV